MNIPAEFRDKRKRKVKRLDLEESNEESCTFSDKYVFNLEIKEVIDVMVSQLKWKSEKLNEVSLDFQFLTGEKVMSMDTEDLKKAASDLALKYSIDMNAVEFSSEICSFKNHAITIIPDIKDATSLDLLQTIHEYDLVQSYPNLEVALRIFLTIPVTVAFGERSFSKLKLIKTYLRSSLGQEKLSNMAILEQEIISQVDFETIINDFASLKAKKIKL